MTSLHHEAVAGAAAEVDQPVEHEGTALLVGLDDDADAVPAGEVRVGGHRLDQVERQLQPVGLLGVDVEADVGAPGQHQQAFQARQQLRHDAPVLGPAIAGMQRRQFHRDARSVAQTLFRAGLADGPDRVLVGGLIARRVGRGHRRLAQHVVGEAVAPGLPRAGCLERLLDRLAGHELLAQQAHGEVDRGADHRLAAPGDQAGQRRPEAFLARGGDQLAGDQQAPGRGIDEDGRAVAEMGPPVALAELVPDQPVGGGGIGDAQQRLGQAHQRDPLLAGEGKFLHQRVDAGRARALGPHRQDQPPGGRLHRRRLPGRRGAPPPAAAGRQTASSSRHAAVMASLSGDCEWARALNGMADAHLAPAGIGDAGHAYGSALHSVRRRQWSSAFRVDDGRSPPFGGERRSGCEDGEDVRRQQHEMDDAGEEVGAPGAVGDDRDREAERHQDAVALRRCRAAAAGRSRPRPGQRSARRGRSRPRRCPGRG